VAAAIMLLGLVTAWLSPPPTARAQSQSAYDLINTVNALRASLGLAAYSIDPWLMSYAQGHADYLDSLNYGTHVHSDGTLPWDSGIQENVASGDAGVVTVTVVVYQIWVDEGHRKPMVGYTSGSIGAGVAYSADNDQIYYVIDVRPGAEADSTAAAPAATAGFVPYVTNTPRPDGWIMHTVTAGQTLWSIAISYGTTVNAIRELNGIPSDSTVIYVGQELKVIQGSDPPLPAARQRQRCWSLPRPVFCPAPPPSHLPRLHRHPVGPRPAHPPAGWSGCPRSA